MREARHHNPLRIFVVVALLALFSCLGLCAPALAQSDSAKRAPVKRGKLRPDVAAFGAQVDAALAGKGAEKGYWAVLVEDATSGEVLFALNTERFFAPASNTKLFTTALALAALGPDYRFRTTIESRGTVDRYGRLRGDLVLVGRGDPNLSNRTFPFSGKGDHEGSAEKVLAELADAVFARGVKQIEGNIVADDSYFSYERFPSGWAIDDMLWNYGAAVSALSVNDNTVTLELRPGEREGDAAWFGVEPWAEYYKIQNDVGTGPAGSERELEASREPGSRTILLRGTIPLGAEPHTLTFGVEEPAEYAARLLKRLLEARGVRIYGEARARHLPEDGAAVPAVLAEHVSVPLAEAIRVVNKISQNLHAELLLRVAAREKTGATTTDAALKFAQDFWKGIGIEEGEVLLYDGSGLSRRNLLTPRAVVQLLAWAEKQPWAEAFRASLPAAGEDGTLEDRMKNTAAVGRLWAKTGSLEHVNALSGYATSVRGEKLVFSIFGNNHALKYKEATAVVDALAVAMVEELGVPPAGKKKR